MIDRARVEWLRSHLVGRELRFLDGRIELRAGDKGPVVRMTIPYNSESDDMGGFREVVRPGAFAKSLQERDIMSLWQHDPQWVLGRTGNNTLSLRQVDHALVADVQLDGNDVMHRHFARRIERRDVTGTSFGFEKVRDDWGGVASDGLPLRTLQDVRLFDVSPVTYPAYPGSGATIDSEFPDSLGSPRPARHHAHDVDEDHRRRLWLAERIAHRSGRTDSDRRRFLNDVLTDLQPDGERRRVLRVAELMAAGY